MIPDGIKWNTYFGAAADRWFLKNGGGRKELELQPWYNSLAGASFPIKRGGGSKTLDYSKWLLDQGANLVIFPEGTIPEENIPQMIPFKNGAFRLAKNLKVPILPLTFTQNFHLFSDPTQWLGPAHPGFVDVHIHPFISAQEVEESSIESLSEKCFKLIEAPLHKAHPQLFKNA